MQGAMTYKADFLISLVSGGFAVFIQFFLWRALYRGSNQTELYGYDYSQMVVYIIMAGIMGKITQTNFQEDIMFDVMEGNMNRFFVQPIGHLPYRVIGFLGKKTVQYVMVILISAGLLVTLSFTVGAKFSAGNIIAGLLISPLSLLLNCMLFYCISAVSFWLLWAWGVFNGLQVITSILGGGLFPLTVFGEKAMAVLRFLPFQYVIYFPLNVVVGNETTNGIISGIAMQIIWILLLFGLSKIVWRIGMKKYIAAGG